jgi:hypothetical protein
MGSVLRALRGLDCFVGLDLNRMILERLSVMKKCKDPREKRFSEDGESFADRVERLQQYILSMSHRSNRIESNVDFIDGIAKVNESVKCSRVDRPHELNLCGFLGQITLVATKSIDP